MPLVKIPLASKSDPARREVVSEERLTNYYAVKASEEARAPFYLNRTPGMTAWSRPSSDLCRGLFDADGEALAVYGSTLFSFNLNSGSTSRGTISGTRDVRWSQNNATDRETVIATGTTTYQYKAGTLTVIGGDLAGIDIVDTICVDGITICFTEAGRAYYSPVNDANSYSSPNFFDIPGTGKFKAAQEMGDQFVCWREHNQFVYRHTEDSDEPFQLLTAASKAFGCLNTFSNASGDGQKYLVDQFGMPRVISQGYNPVPIGEEGVCGDIRDLADKEELRLWYYNAGNRGFLVVHSSEFCWVYDFKEARWHNRQSYQRVTWKAKHYCRFANKDLVATDQSGDLFYLDDASFSEDGEHVVWDVTLPTVTNFPNGGTIHALHFDIEVGTGLDASAPEEDQEPRFTVFISRDAGKTWGTGRQISLGKRGQWRKRLSLNRCGDFGREGFIVRIQGAGKTPNAIMNCFGEITQKAA